MEPIIKKLKVIKPFKLSLWTRLILWFLPVHATVDHGATDKDHTVIVFYQFWRGEVIVIKEMIHEF